MKVRSPQPYLDIKSTRAQLQINSERMQLQIKSTRARMRVRRTRPKMKVNWKAVRAQTGMKSPSYQRKHMQQVYRNKALQGISKVSSTYDRMTDIHQAGLSKTGAEIVATVAFSNTMQQNLPVVDIASMPQSMPDIEWEQGSMEIEWEPAELEMEWVGSVKPQIDVTPHTVEIRLISGETIRVAENKARSLERQGYGKRIDREV